jgi:4'-phosphopantetheinyl transferase
VEPAAVELRVTPRGRPVLDPAWGLEFSTSNDDGLAVIAIAVGRRVGVDVERFRELDDALDLAAGYLHPSELASLRSRPAGARSRAFLELWTRKEALVKALGGGLSIPLDTFDASTEGAADVVHLIGAPGGASWTILALAGLPSHVGSIAVEGPDASVQLMGALGVAA